MNKCNKLFLLINIRLAAGIDRIYTLHVAYFCTVPKRAIAILLLLSLFYQTFLKLGIVIWYHVNKDYIASTLCENRNRPEKKCCGRCYLNKQLRKADGNEKGANGTVPEKWNMGEIAAYILPQPFALRLSIEKVEKQKYGRLHQTLPSAPPSEFFHPPGLSC